MIERQKDADFLNKVVNDPSIYPWVHGTIVGALDLTPVAKDPRNVLLAGEHGTVLYMYIQPGIYEGHTSVLTAGRGEWAVEFAKATIAYMFTKTDAVELVTKVPKGNLGARALTKLIGGKLEFRNPRGWIINHEIVYADVFSLTIQDWIRGVQGMESLGDWFHTRLEQEYKTMCKSATVHEEDPVHDKYVGICVSMILGGQPEKGVVFYNRWARLAGYEPITLLSRNPLVFDIQDAIIQVDHSDIRVMC